MTNLIESNRKLTNMSKNIKTAQEKRVVAVQDAINAVLDYTKNNKEIFVNKKTCIAIFCKEYLADKSIDIYTKRAIKVARMVLVDGYKMRKELLTLAQMEQLLTFTKKSVNDLMDTEEEFYLEKVKELIKSAKVKKSTKVFSSAKAKKL